MINWTKILEEINKFVSLPASKQIIFIMATSIVISVLFNISSYYKKKKVDEQKDLQLIEYKDIIAKNLTIKDSLIEVIYSIKLENFENNLKRSDSLLRESQKIRNSIIKSKR